MSSNATNPPAHDDIAQYKGIDSGDAPQDAGSIYENGNVLKINIDDLKGNDVAIKQLVNGHNLAQKDLHKLITKIALKESEIEYLRTSPFISISCTIFNVIFVIVVGIGVNLLTGNVMQNIGFALVIIGGLGTICSGIATLLFPYARGFFNSKNDKSKEQHILRSK